MVSLNQHRNKIVRELFETEKTYISQLKEIIEVFEIPLSAHLESFGLSKADFSTIFPVFRSLWGLHEQLLRKLEDRLQYWTPRKKIADIFLELSPYMKMYSQYIQTYSPQHLSNILNTNKKLRKWVEEQKSQKLGSGELYLSSLLIVPIQRIPRYELLLKDLIKFTPKYHVDYDDLMTAYERIKEVAEFINTSEKNTVPHQFVTKFFSSPTWCDHCLEFLWGVWKKQGCLCTGCGIVVHEKCSKAVDLHPCVNSSLGVGSDQRSKFDKKFLSLKSSSKKFINEILK